MRILMIWSRKHCMVMTDQIPKVYARNVCILFAPHFPQQSGHFINDTTMRFTGTVRGNFFFHITD